MDTNREREVLTLIAQGKEDKEIANGLYITVSTVYSHTHAIYRKLNVRGRTEATAYYWRKFHESMDTVDREHRVL